jgi:hypothetical protein
MVDVRVGDGEVGHIGRAIADFGQLTLERPHHHGSSRHVDVSAGTLCGSFNGCVRDHTEIPQQCPPGMRHQKTRHREAGLTDFLGRDLVTLSSSSVDVDQAAIENIQPEAAWRRRLDGIPRLRSASGAATQARGEHNRRDS